MGNEPDAAGYELRFEGLSRNATDLVFPCDASGHVDLDGLDERLRADYLFAHVLRGRDFAPPVVSHR